MRFLCKAQNLDTGAPPPLMVGALIHLNSVLSVNQTK